MESSVKELSKYRFECCGEALEDAHIMGEEHIILSERLEEQLKAVGWAKAEQKRLQKEKGDRISKELMEEMTPLILQRNEQFDKIPSLR
jgi:trehalose utilization protein